MAAAQTFVNFRRTGPATRMGVQMASASQPFKAGSFIQFDAAAFNHKQATVTADGPNVVGVLEGTNPPESAPGGSNEIFDPAMVVLTEGEFDIFGKNGETYKPYDPLVIDSAGAFLGQSVRAKQGGDAANTVIAIVSPNTDAAGVSITASGQTVRALIVPQFLSGSNVR